MAVQPDWSTAFPDRFALIEFWADVQQHATVPDDQPEDRVQVSGMRTFLEVNAILEPGDSRRYVWAVVGSPGAWRVIIRRANGARAYVLESQRGQLRTWKTADGCIRFLDECLVPREAVVVVLGDAP